MNSRVGNNDRAREGRPPSFCRLRLRLTIPGLGGPRDYTADELLQLADKPWPGCVDDQEGVGRGALEQREARENEQANESRPRSHHDVGGGWATGAEAEGLEEAMEEGKSGGRLAYSSPPKRRRAIPGRAGRQRELPSERALGELPTSPNGDEHVEFGGGGGDLIDADRRGGDISTCRLTATRKRRRGGASVDYRKGNGDGSEAEEDDEEAYSGEQCSHEGASSYTRRTSKRRGVEEKENANSNSASVHSEVDADDDCDDGDPSAPENEDACSLPSGESDGEESDDEYVDESGEESDGEFEVDGSEKMAGKDASSKENAVRQAESEDVAAATGTDGEEVRNRRAPLDDISSSANCNSAACDILVSTHGRKSEQPPTNPTGKSNEGEAAAFLPGGFSFYTSPAEVHAMCGGRDKLVGLSKITPVVARDEDLSEEDLKRTSSYRSDLAVQAQKGYPSVFNYGRHPGATIPEMQAERMMALLPDQLDPAAVSFFHANISIVNAQMKLYGCNHCNQTLSYGSTGSCCDYQKVIDHVQGDRRIATLGGCLTRFDPCSSCGLTYEEAKFVPAPISGKMLVVDHDFGGFANHKGKCAIGDNLELLRKKIETARKKGKATVNIPKEHKLDQFLTRATGKKKDNGQWKPFIGAQREKLEPLLPSLRRGKDNDEYSFA